MTLTSSQHFLNFRYLKFFILISCLALLLLGLVASSSSSPRQLNIDQRLRHNTIEDDFYENYENQRYDVEQENYYPENDDDNDQGLKDDGVDLIGESSNNGYDYTDLLEESLDTFQVTNLLLASDVEGNLHALNRLSGELVWTLQGSTPLVVISSDDDVDDAMLPTPAPDSGMTDRSINSESSSLTPSESSATQDNNKQQHNHNNNPNHSRKKKRNSYTEMTWIIEPFDEGAVYFFTQESGLQRLPTSIRQLILKSPFSIGDDFIYTGVRKSGIVTVDANTGELIDAFGIPDINSCAASGNQNDILDEFLSSETENQDTEDRPVILLGRTTYELSIHSKNNTSWNITYTTWGPNNLHTKLANENTESTDNLYIQPFHDNSILALDSETKSVRWLASLPSVTVNLFDVFSKDQITDGKQFIVLPHPLQAKSLSNSASSSPSSSYAGFGGHGSTYIDRTRDGSWFAMSESHYPSFVKSAPLAKYISDGKWRSPIVLKNRELLGLAITGVHDNSLQELLHGDNNNNNNNNNLLNRAGGKFRNNRNHAYPAGLPESRPTSIHEDPRNRYKKSQNRLSLPADNSRLAIEGPNNNNNRAVAVGGGAGGPGSGNMRHPPLSIHTPTSTSKVAPFAKLVYRAFENVIVTFLVG
ncbi:unnamed protein product [Ambrosiozyma monospora]|uniref:Unnamed protein product n=1 Tax=Ambrosiozyma monospora TaxID=43982 RepID=A0ACB5SVY9_AMBMO|nr:unnamed protein product [Ambrosiozyma monospora]